LRFFVCVSDSYIMVLQRYLHSSDVDFDDIDDIDDQNALTYLKRKAPTKEGRHKCGKPDH
jgi:hypothetical protein